MVEERFAARQEVRGRLRRRGRPPAPRAPWTTTRAGSTSTATSGSPGIGTGARRRAGAAPRQGGPAGHPRPRPARRHPDRVRPGARHPLRLARGGGRAPRRVRQDDRAARHRHRDGAAGRGGDRAEDGARRTGWTRPSRSSRRRGPRSRRRRREPDDALPRARVVLALPLHPRGDRQRARDLARGGAQVPHRRRLRLRRAPLRLRSRLRRDRAS